MAHPAGGEKTEQPTAKRLRDAREKGQVARSRDLSSAILLLAAIAILWTTSGYLGELFLSAAREQISFAASFNGDFTQKTAGDAMWNGLRLLALALAPFFAVMFIAAFATNYLQIGAIFSFEAVKPDFGKLNPTENFKRNFFQSRAYIELGKTIVKIIVATIIAAWVLWNATDDLLRLTNQPTAVAVYFAFNLALEILLKVGLALLVIGGVDYFLQQFLHRKELMMTRREIKEEHKETEGNPHVKSRRRFLHREIVSQNMAEAVKRATVVVADPTPLAIALRYERGETGVAPMIAAKGTNLMAVKIREIAEEAGVPVTSDVPLARALYKLEIDDEIPEELYEAVAIVLRWIYELEETENGKRKTEN